MKREKFLLISSTKIIFEGRSILFNELAKLELGDKVSKAEIELQARIIKNLSNKKFER